MHHDVFPDFVQSYSFGCWTLIDKRLMHTLCHEVWPYRHGLLADKTGQTSRQCVVAILAQPASQGPRYDNRHFSADTLHVLFICHTEHTRLCLYLRNSAFVVPRAVMDYQKVIRVQIDHPTHPLSSVDNDRSKYIGFLGAELAEAEEALLAGKHLEFSWLPWAAKSKDTVVKTVTPSQPVTPGVIEFQQQVHADLQRMIQLLESMANIMAGQIPQPMPAPASLPMSASVVPPLRPVTNMGQVMPKNGGSIYTMSAQVFPVQTPSTQGLVDGRQPQYFTGTGYAV